MAAGVRTQSPPTARRTKYAVTAAFALNGFVLASWLSRVPAVRTILGLDQARLGLLLLCLSGGALAAMVASGPVVGRLGPARAVLASSLVVGVGLLGLAAASAVVSVPLSAVSLVAIGVGTAPWDVAMNVEAADVERRLGRPIMPRFHAGFSLGTVAGAGLGAGTAALGVAVGVQLVVTAVLAVTVVAAAVGSFSSAGAPAEPGSGGAVGLRAAWLDRRTIAIGFFALAFALTEGVANDWLAVAFVDGHDTSGAIGAIGFGAFVAAMTVGRVSGGAALARFGRVATLRASAVTALAGLLLVCLGGPAWLVFAGAALWGLGACLGFPVGMSAASQDPARAASRVSVVATIGYTAFLAGPPLIGFLAHEFGILRALLVIVVPLVAGFVLAGSTRETPTAATVPAA